MTFVNLKDKVCELLARIETHPMMANEEKIHLDRGMSGDLAMWLADELGIQLSDE